jgi:propane monooxygenase reductase subunit
MARVYFEPINEEIECGEDETVLDAAFNHGFSLVYGCREGQCSACKSFVLEGEVTLKRYSTFALSDSEEASGYTLLCRAMPDSDLTIELLHVPDDYRLEHAIRDGEGTVTACEALTRDIFRLTLDVDPSLDFTPGQYMDLHVPGTEVRRSFSMANTPSDPAPGQLEFLIKAYPGGQFAELLAGGLRPGTPLAFTGPYGSLRLSGSQRDVLLVAGGSGMAPVLSLLRQLAGQSSRRRIRFFYGARRHEDLFYRPLVEELGTQLADFAYTEVLSDAPAGSWPGATGWVHEAAAGALAAGDLTTPEIYTCGPPPMVDALIEILCDGQGVGERDIHFDKFTTAVEPD